MQAIPAGVAGELLSCAMLQQLDTWDKQALIFLNGLHADVLDPVIFYVTKTEFWIPLYLYLIYLIFRDHRR